MQESANRLKKYIYAENRLQDHFEVRELCAMFTTDVVGSAVYGVESRVFSGEKSEIREVARTVMRPSWRLFCITMIGPFYPWITKIIKMKFCPDKEANFIISLLNGTLKYRKENNVKRNDFLDYLIYLREKKGITDVETAAWSLTFFFDGIETSALTLSNIFYEV